MITRLPPFTCYGRLLEIIAYLTFHTFFGSSLYRALQQPHDVRMGFSGAAAVPAASAGVFLRTRPVEAFLK